VLSLGAGVQSTTLALMAARGAISPMPDCAIFADTQWEPQAVYDHLDWLSGPGILPFPVHRVTAGNIREAIKVRRNTSGGRFAAIPWHTVNPDGSHGLGRRQCTSEYKLTPIMHEIRRLVGKPGHKRIAAGAVTVILGISRDEAHRMKPARQAYMRNVYPLVELGLTRDDCLAWLQRYGYPQPPKSCNGTDCPAAHYHLVSGTKTLPGISGICFRAIQGSAIYAMDGYGVWSQWNATTKAFAPVSPLSPDCAPLPYSRDGTMLTAPGASIVTAAGTFSLDTATCFGANSLLLNGKATGGCGKILLVHQDGQVFTADVNGNWWKWNGSGWTNLGTTTQP
jgi:hypothetical protein